MSKRGGKRKQPEQGMTKAEAVGLVGFVCGHLEDPSTNEALQAFVLLLRYLAYKGTKDDAKTVYIMTETANAAEFPSVDDAILDDLTRTLEAHRKREKGGA